MNPDCETCSLDVIPDHVIWDTDYWRVNLGLNQHYFGRAFAVLKNHKGSLGEMYPDEWRDFQSMSMNLERAYGELFGAAPLNWVCLMNAAYRKPEPIPHVHWHILPRYKEAPVFEGQRFSDVLYGDLFDSTAETNLSANKISRISSEIRSRLQTYK